MSENTKLIFEWGVLKRIKHEGWRIAGIDNPGSVAAHSLRAAQIAFVIAKMEGYDNPHKACSMAVFHDIGECRIGDIHKVGARYIDADEERAVKDQVSEVDFGEEIVDMWKQVDERRSDAGNIAKDADLIEQAFTAKEYMERGYAFAEDWIKNVGKKIKTDSAKKLWKELQEVQSNEWWQGLKKI